MTTFDEFQRRIATWCVQCFGNTTADDVQERNWRFLEESLELVQSLGGTAEDAHKMVDYVFSRPVGEADNELGGTLVTLAALAAANGLSMRLCGEVEMRRIESPEVSERIRQKHASKPLASPLPGDYPNHQSG